jgi:hypothetical protein
LHKRQTAAPHTGRRSFLLQVLVGGDEFRERPLLDFHAVNDRPRRQGRVGRNLGGEVGGLGHGDAPDKNLNRTEIQNTMRLSYVTLVLWTTASRCQDRSPNSDGRVIVVGGPRRKPAQGKPQPPRLPGPALESAAGRKSKRSQTPQTPPPPAGPELLARRVEEVLQALLRGVREADVVVMIRELWPEQALEPLIQGVQESLVQSAAADPRVLHGWCLQSTRLVYQQALQNGQLAEALRAIKLTADLAKWIPNFHQDDEEQATGEQLAAGQSAPATAADPPAEPPPKPQRQRKKAKRAKPRAKRPQKVIEVERVDTLPAEPETEP